MRRYKLALIFLGFYMTAGASVWREGLHPLACHADFSWTADAGNPMMIRFTDKSTGVINHWQWSFGDGVTSTLQNPEHTYAYGGTYFVCLTVSDSDTGFLCNDALCLMVTVHQPGRCIADYISGTDSLNPKIVQFTDRSTGNIDSWQWNFGDGTYSGEQNPQHTFPALGKFEVCLTVYHSDSMSVCNNTKCDTVRLQQEFICNAAFSYKLDSLNNESNTFIFTDSSEGSPNKYFWSFDDGSSYFTKNVVHRFKTAGVHEVCLKIEKEALGTVYCTDSLCQSVVAARYFNLGGHLFAGQYPINNPVSTGDTGIAYLYRKAGSRLVPYDTMKFTSLGYYAFPNKLNGQYVVRTELTPGSAHFNEYFPSYHPQAMKWQDAVPIALTDSNSFASNVHLLPRTLPEPGPGRIAGTITEAGANGFPGYLGHAEVIMFDGGMKALTCTQATDDGAFEILNLSFGAYYLYVEVPGQFSRLTPVWIDESRPVADDILLEVFGYDVTGARDDPNNPFVSGTLFPNPASGDVVFSIHAGMNRLLDYTVLSVTGDLITKGKFPCMAGNNHFSIPAGSFAPGIYLLKVSDDTGYGLMTRKLVKL